MPPRGPAIMLATEHLLWPLDLAGIYLPEGATDYNQFRHPIQYYAAALRNIMPPPSATLRRH
jgi:hypothetical protein